MHLCIRISTLAPGKKSPCPRLLAGVILVVVDGKAFLRAPGLPRGGRGAEQSCSGIIILSAAKGKNLNT